VATVHEVVVIGGGPAGLAAALQAADQGCEVALIDSAPRPGGQYYRHLPAMMAARQPEALHHGFGWGAELMSRVHQHPRICTRFSCTVWAARQEADGNLELHLLEDADRWITLLATTVVLAPGAYDRVLPFPGWDLPGVMTPGGAQALLKGQYVLAGRRVVVAGTGPFLLPVAAGLVEAGATVIGVYDANVPIGWARHPRAIGGNAAKLAEGRDYIRVLRRAKVPVRFGRAVTRAVGADTVTAVIVSRLDRQWRVRPGADEVVEVDAACVGWGFTPNVELALALGLEAVVEPRDGSLVVRADASGATSLPSVFAAGEIAGVGGSSLAVIEGHLAGLGAAWRTGHLTERRLSAGRALLRRRARQRRFAAALLEVYPVRPGWTSWLDPDTVLCRCEEVTVGGVRVGVHEMGASDLRSLKLLTRVGMGMCQGRVCGYAAACLLQRETGVPLQDPASLSIRPLVVPVPLGTLANGSSSH